MRKLEQDHLLLEALRRLPLDLQVVIELRYWEKMNSVEIADVVGVSASTIRDRLQKGRQLLKESMGASAPASLGADERAGDIERWAEEIHARMHGQARTVSISEP